MVGAQGRLWCEDRDVSGTVLRLVLCVATSQSLGDEEKERGYLRFIG